MSSRKRYTVEYKVKLIKESEGKNLEKFCKEKQLDTRMFRKWRKKYEQLCILEEYGHAKKRSCGSGRTAFYPELENLLYDWVVDRRSLSLVVRRIDVQNMALSLASELDIPLDVFKASGHWLENFLGRFHLSLRRSTTLFKLEDNEIVKRALSFKAYIDKVNLDQYNQKYAVAMDETAVFMGEQSQATIEHRGASSIYVPSTGYESARVTCILAIRLDGTKVTPLIISKGKKNKIVKISDVFVIETTKAWATQEVIRKWVASTLPLLLRGRERGLLVWDSASTHRANDMKKFLSQQRVDQVMIPAGTTAYLQSLDIAINKPFKDYLRLEINDYIEHRMERNQRGNFVKPSLEEVVGWVKKAWAKITDVNVANALRAGYLDKKYSFKDSAIATHDRLGPLILEKLSEDPTNYDDIFEDIPEEDEIDAVLE